MKVLTLNFLTCARKACKPSPEAFPLRPKDAELELVETDFNPAFLTNMLPRLEWPALKIVCADLGLPALAEEMPEAEALFMGPGMNASKDTAMETDVTEEARVEGEGKEEKSENPASVGKEVLELSQLGKDLHRLLLETTIQEGKLVCGNCGHEYAIKEGIANFLLPAHMV